MKVTVIGATGRTGRRLVLQALGAGHDVAAFTRHPAQFEIEHPRVEVVQGDVQNRDEVEEAVRGRDGVLSGLGPTPSSADDVMTTGARHIVEAMEKHGVDRLIWLTGAGISAEGDERSLLRDAIQGMIKLFSPGVLEDSARAFDLIIESDLDWTVVRVPRLKEGPAQGGYRATFKPPGPQALSRADVAAFMVEQLEDDAYVRQAPMLTY
jgi:putative NADH-flavin reductase